MGTEETLRRFDRIVAIYIQLQSKRLVRAEDLAARFGVSVRTIYRDIRVLEAAGIPLIGEAGAGYSLVDGYRLPPIMFTREEALGFVAAGKLMEAFADKSLGAHYQAALYKVKAVLKAADKEWIGTLGANLLVNKKTSPINEAIPDTLEILLESIANNRQVLLVYRSLREDVPVERVIEPVGVFHESGFWYVMGYCLLRADYRQFRADRILLIRRTPHRFAEQHPPLETLREASRKASVKQKVVIRFQRDMVRYIRRDTQHFGFVSETEVGDEVEMTFLHDENDHFFVRWYLTCGDMARIVEPVSFREQVETLVRDIQKNLAWKAVSAGA